MTAKTAETRAISVIGDRLLGMQEAKITESSVEGWLGAGRWRWDKWKGRVR
jgi:hypothetical protein